MNPYQLIDFGEGRKLERFGPWLLDRPCPATAELSKANLSQWGKATARFTGERTAHGVWLRRSKRWQPDEVTMVVQEALPKPLSFHLAPLPSGQVGLFPEQIVNWQWIMEQTQRATHRVGRSLKVLNLFAYTGGSTMAAALMGAEVTHVDAVKSVVSRARENAKVSSSQELQIRWIVEDAVKFCQREVRRGNQYDAVILDPPSYGHGPQGQTWSIQRGLLPLLELCGHLTSDHRAFVLVTCHSPSIGPAELNAYLADGIFGHCGMPARTGTLSLESADRRQLPSGIYARWPE